MMRKQDQKLPKQSQLSALDDRVMVLHIDGIDDDGHLWCKLKPQDSRQNHKNLQDYPIWLKKDARQGGAAKLGDLMLARLKLEAGTLVAYAVRNLSQNQKHHFAQRAFGSLEQTSFGALFMPVGKGRKKPWHIQKSDMNGVGLDQLVEVEMLPAPARHYAAPHAKILRGLGHRDDPKLYSLISVLTHDIPHEFPQEVGAEAAALPAFDPDHAPLHQDLTYIPFVTVDGEDARDFDDAIAATKTEDGGFMLHVAIADVAHYVAQDGALDTQAQHRGNSVYFPDLVIPMLPERLSNDLCSLRPQVIRPVLCVKMKIDGQGKLTSYEFNRGYIYSRARLTYNQLEAALDGTSQNPDIAPLIDPILKPLYHAWQALRKSRKQRGALELTTSEFQVELDDQGKIKEVHPRTQLQSHQIIEDFMITANVAAAKALENANKALLYRAHPPPPADKFDAFQDGLAATGYELSNHVTPTTQFFNQLLAKAEAGAPRQLLSDLILRSQSQAVYQPEQEGHFGLQLTQYCHFTSPIRRYADLTIHRALIAIYGFDQARKKRRSSEQDFLKAELDLTTLGAHLVTTERRAQAAERDSLSRFMAAYMQDRVGAQFEASVTGVKYFGLFVGLKEIGAEGFAPHPFRKEGNHNHRRSRTKSHIRQSPEAIEQSIPYHVGDIVKVRLKEVTPLDGGMIFELLNVKSSNAGKTPHKNKPFKKSKKRIAKPRKK
ncbi:MAG: ribonuclease R family protein [Alphaproteobacteria bacterium]